MRLAPAFVVETDMQDERTGIFFKLTTEATMEHTASPEHHTPAMELDKNGSAFECVDVLGH